MTLNEVSDSEKARGGSQAPILESRGPDHYSFAVAGALRELAEDRGRCHGARRV